MIHRSTHRLFLASFLLLLLPRSARAVLETVYISSSPPTGYTTSRCNNCGGSCTASTANTQNNAGVGCHEGDWGSGTAEYCGWTFTPATSVQTNTYTIALRWRGGDDGSCGSNNGAEFVEGSQFYNYNTPGWAADFGDPPFADGSWAAASYTLCSSKSACAPYYQASPKQLQLRIKDTDGGFLQNQDGIEFDYLYLEVSYDPTAPSVSWTDANCGPLTNPDFSTYNTDGTGCVTLNASDSGGSGLAAADYCWVRWKSANVWTGWSKTAENGYVCTSTGGNNQYIQCEAYCEDQVNNLSTTASTTNSLVDLVDPSSSTPTIDNPFFSPQASAGVKDTATTSMSPTDSASGIDCVQLEVKDSTGATHVRWHTAGSCGGDTNYAAWVSNPTTWAWDGVDDGADNIPGNGDDFNAPEGTYRVYVKAQDKAGKISPAAGSTDTQTCAVETITYGASIAGNCASTASNNSVYRDIDEQNLAAAENKVAYSGANSYGTVNSGTYATTQVSDNVRWDWNEGCDWCGLVWPACYMDFKLYYNTDVPETTVTALRLQTEYTTQDDDIELYFYNYDAGSYSDRGTGVPVGQPADTTFNYNLCTGAMGVCNAWVSGSGNVSMSWFDEQNCGFEDSDYYKIDYQHVRVEYNERKLDVAYQFNSTVAKSDITSVEVRTDAYSGNEPMTIQKWNYTTSAWVSTGYSTPSTEPAPQIVPVCSGASACNDYIFDSGANRQVKMRYVDTVSKDATVNRLKIDYQQAYINWGTTWVETVVDRTNPTTSDDWTDVWTAASPVSITLSPSDNLSGVEWTKYCIDTTNTCDPTTGTTGTNPQPTCAAGSACTQYVRYTSRDNAGNTGATGSKRVRQDLQTPTTTDDWTDNWTATSPITVTLTPSDGSGSGIASTSYCVDTANTCSPSTSGTSVSVTCAAGSVCVQYVRYASSDNVGNGEGTNSKRVRQDREIPTLGLTSVEGDTAATYYDNANDANTDIVLTSSDGSGSGTSACRWYTTDSAYNGGTGTACATTTACSITGAATEGSTYSRYIACVDAVGNGNTTANNLDITWTNDYTAPPLTLTSLEGDTGSPYYDTTNDSNTDIVLTSTDAVSGTTACRWYTTDTAYSAGSGTACASATACQFTGAAAADTTYTRYISCVDAAGNGNSTANNLNITWMNDWTAPPVPTISSVKNSGNGKLSANWSTVTDTGSGLASYELDRDAVQIATPGSGDTAYQNTGLTSGTQYCYRLRAKDAAANLSGNSTSVCKRALLANEDVATGPVSGFPASSANSGGFYVGTITAENVGNGRLHILKADATREAGAFIDLPAGAGAVVGPPFWVNEGTDNVIYVGTTSGNLYKLKNVDGGTVDNPDGNTLCFCDPTGAGPCATCAGTPAWASTALLDSCGAANVTITTQPYADANIVCAVVYDSDCAAGTKQRYVCVETAKNGAAGSDANNVEKVVNKAVCDGSQIKSVPKIVTNGAWALTNIHVGSNCQDGGGANTVKLYRIDADLPAGDCAASFSGNAIDTWITGDFGKLFFASTGTGKAIHMATNSEMVGCATVYDEPASFPYDVNDYAALGTITEGCVAHWAGAGDEVYCAGQDGKLYCVCQDASAPCTGAGNACTGFPKALEGGTTKLMTPLIIRGNVYVLAENGNIWAVEAFSDNSTTDDVAAASGDFVGCSQGYGQTAATTYDIKFGAANIASNIGYNSSAGSGAGQILVGTNNGYVFYLPRATSTCP